MTVSRGWAPVEGDERWDAEGYFDHVRARCDALMQRWNVMATTIEEEGWRRQRSYEDGEGGEFDDLDYPKRRWYAEDAEGQAEYERDVEAIEVEIAARSHAIRVRNEEQRLELEFCEEKLADLGARVMRPYEHWNEDEQLMAYLERDR